MATLCGNPKVEPTPNLISQTPTLLMSTLRRGDTLPAHSFFTSTLCKVTNIFPCPPSPSILLDFIFLSCFQFLCFFPRHNLNFITRSTLFHSRCTLLCILRSFSFLISCNSLTKLRLFLLKRPMKTK